MSYDNFGAGWSSSRDYQRTFNSQYNKNQQQIYGDPSYYEQKTKESLRESLRVAAETNEIGQRTAEQLNEQTEQLQRIRQDVDDVSHNLDTSQYLIKGMKSWWGSVVQLFTSPPTQESSSRATIPLQNQPTRTPSLHSSSLQSRTSKQGSNVPPTSSRDYRTETESEIDNGLDTLSDMLSEMHARALGLNSELSMQNVMVDNIRHGVEENSDRLTKQKKDIDKLLKK